VARGASQFLRTKQTMNIEAKKQVVLDALDMLFSDTSVDKKTTLRALEQIQDVVDTKVDSLWANIKHDSNQK
jgi:hypothetical protein